jgi:4a-hydroxytetrahydrobiopterin dehydratase
LRSWRPSGGAGHSQRHDDCEAGTVYGMAELLSSDDLATALAELDGWSGTTQGIERAIEAPGFLDGIRLVDAVAEAAERADHHPDIDIRWRTVTFRLSTHSKGGVTDNDIALAKEINAIAKR